MKNTKKTRPIQKVVFYIALFSYFCATVCLALALYWNNGTQDPLVASMMASIVFFIGVGVVLHVIARTNLPNLKVDNSGHR